MAAAVSGSQDLITNLSTDIHKKSTLSTRYPQIVGNLWISCLNNVENFRRNFPKPLFINVEYVYNYSHSYPQNCG